MKDNGYTKREIMAIAAAREIEDGDIVFCGGQAHLGSEQRDLL